MSVSIQGKTTSRTTVELIHESGSRIITMAPKDNGGDGSAFSPTDLCAASLGACALTIMNMMAVDKGIPVEKMEFVLIKEMSPPPRRISRLVIKYIIQGSFSDSDYSKLVAAGKSCPIRLTLNDVVEIEETWERN